MTRPAAPRSPRRADHARRRRPLAGADPVDRRPAGRGVRHAQPAPAARSRSSSSSGNGNGNGGRRRRTVTPAPSNVVIVPPEVVTVQGLDRLRQGRQHLGPDGQGRQAADQGRRRLDAVLGARRILDLLRPDGQRERPLAGRQRPARLRTDDPDRDAHQGRRQRGAGSGPERAGDQRRADLARLDPRTGRLARTARRWRWSPIARTRRRATSFSSSTTSPPRSRRVPKVAETPPLGHQDPAWRPDGKVLLYVRNGRNGARGAPVIYRSTSRRRRASALTGPGYLEPAFSPDGRYVAATKTSSFGNDLVILDAAQRPRAPAPDQRRGVVGAGLVADRRRDRVPPHRGPDRRPQAGPARGRCRRTGRSRTSPT